MPDIASTSLIWNFGTVSNNTIVDTEGVTRDSAYLQTQAATLEPAIILQTLSDSGDLLRYQVGTITVNGVTSPVSMTTEDIQDDVDNGRFYMTEGGLIFDTDINTTLDPDTVGFELQTILITKINEDVSALNELLEMLTVLDGWINNGVVDDKNESQTITTNLWDGGDGFNDYLAGRMGDFTGDEQEYYITANNLYVDWHLGKSTGYATLSPAEDAYFDTDNFRWVDAKREGYYDFTFGSAYLIPGSDVQATTKTIDFTDKSEIIRNLVKEKSTQTEQLSTDFQTRNSRYNAMMEAMSNYAQTYFDSLKALIS